MYTFQKLGLICVLLSLLFSLSACGKKASTPADVLTAMCAAEPSLPAGICVTRSAPEESEKHLSDSLLTATFGNGRLPPEVDKIADAACFFAYTQPCELAVFRCKSSTDAKEVAKMCLRRLDMLKTQYSQSGNAHPYFDTACVSVRGKWVVLCISSDPAAVLRAFRRAS